LPAFNPDDDRDPLPAAVADLRAEIAAADAAIARDLVGVDGIVAEPTVQDGLASEWTAIAEHLEAQQQNA
jgi:hypothetical protein